MKLRIIITIIGAIAANCAMLAQQPKWVKKAAKSVFTLKTFAADETMIGSTNGFYIGESGEAVSSFRPFRGASRAIVIDAQGKEWNVECILGANETYDVVKFRTAARSTSPLPMAAAAAGEGSPAWILPYSGKKTTTALGGKISKAETFQENYTYYTIITPNVPENTMSSPLVNDNGEAVGLLQESAKATDTVCHAVGVTFIADLKIGGLSINDPTLKSTTIKKDLPDNIDQALLTMYVAASATDSATYAGLVEDFIRKFPNASDGYIYRAQLNTGAGNFSAADEDMAQAIKVADKKDEAHYSYSGLIYQKELYSPDRKYEPWTLDRAADEAEEAYKINPLPIYRQRKAQIRFAQKRYGEAYDIYGGIIAGGTRTAEIYYEASRCKELAGDSAAMLALLDSAVNTFSRPYLKEAAPYLFARAQALSAMKEYRKAVADYNEYEHLMSSQLTDRFYYIRALVEMEGHLYQPAINDMKKAIEKNPKNTLYLAEKASFEIRLNLLDDAMATAQMCIDADSSLSDGYLFLGLAQCLKGNKAEGIANLQKAKELGDSQAEGLMEKYR